MTPNNKVYKNMTIEYEMDSKKWEETKDFLARVIWYKTQYPWIKEKAEKIQKEIDEVNKKEVV